MKNFNIEIISKNPELLYNAPSHWGRITIGNFSEKFLSSIEDWSLDDYLKQWKSGLERIKICDLSCLVVSVELFKNIHPSVEIWALYRSSKTIFIQNHFVTEETIKDYELPLSLREFSRETCYRFVSNRETVSSDDVKISEWSCSLNDIINWLESENNAT